MKNVNLETGFEISFEFLTNVINDYKKNSTRN